MSIHKKARLVKKNLHNWNGDASLYRLDPPMEDQGRKIEFVVVSAVNALYSGPETYVFEADEKGTVSNWGELDGSFRGSLDHAEALGNAGYEVSA